MSTPRTATNTIDDEQLFPRRSLHFVGSLPPDVALDEQTGMQWILDQVGDQHLTALPCDRDPIWIIDYLRSLADVEALETVKAGDFTTYSDFAVYRLRRGHQLQPADLVLGRASEVRTAMAARAKLDAVALPAHQVSAPSPLDLAMFAFGSPLPALRQMPVFATAISDEIRQICAQFPDDVLFQLESPAVLAAFHQAPRPLWPVLARVLARQVASVLVATPHNARFVVHLCYGDLGHKALFAPEDLSPAVMFINALKRRLAALGQAMPVVHLPIAHGDQPPSIDRQFYSPLRYLKGDIDVVAGLVAEDHEDQSHQALRLLEDELGRPALAVAASCGLGRRSAGAAAANVRLALRLAAQSTAPFWGGTR